MNKKIFTLFLVLAASAIFAVSCNNKTTNPTESAPTSGDTQTTPSAPTGGSSEVKNITDEQIANALKTALKDLTVNSTDKIKDGTYSKGTYTAEVDAATAKPKKSTTKTSLEGKKASIKSELEKVGIVLDDSTDYTVTDSSATGTVTLKVSAKEGYKLPEDSKNNIKIAIKTTNSSNNTWDN